MRAHPARFCRIGGSRWRAPFTFRTINKSEDLKDVRKARQKLYTEGAVVTASVSAAMPALVVE